MKRLLLALIILVPLPLFAAPQKVENTGPSPHSEALALVFQTQEKKISEVDRATDEDWWLDTKERHWIVRRPIAPGYVDSTHMFEVVYKVEGQVVAVWLVDTRARTVQIQKEPIKSSTAQRP